MKGYSTREVAELLDLPPPRVRRWARELLESAARGPEGEYRFSFQDLVLLRTARELSDARVPPRRIRRALRELREALPQGRPLTAVRVAAEGERVVVRDGEAVWNPESGQLHFDFAASALDDPVAPLARRAEGEARATPEGLGPEGWFQIGCDLEQSDRARARDAYRRALELDPWHADAHVNLGLLLQEEGRLAAASGHYRAALAADPEHATAAYDLGVALDEAGELTGAAAAYRQALRVEPEFADAHYNLARVCERLGDRAAALRHFSAYRGLTGEA